MKRKIKVCCNWASSEDITKRLLLQFATEKINLSDVEFVHDNSYDILVVFGHLTGDVIPGDPRPIYLFPQEPTWSGNHQKSFESNPNLVVYGYGIHKYSIPETVRVINHHAMMFYGGVGPVGEGWETWTYENIARFSEPKTKFMSSIVSSLSVDHGSECLYPQRANLIRHLIDAAPYLDVYGWNVPDKSNVLPLPRKIEGLRNYKFSLAIENAVETGWITEKFYDCIITNTVPVYYGCPEIKEMYPEDGYILIDNIEDHEAVTRQLEHLRDNADAIYAQKLSGMMEIKRRFFTDYNSLQFILDLPNASKPFLRVYRNGLLVRSE
jgi:hypothetical protein